MNQRAEIMCTPEQVSCCCSSYDFHSWCSSAPRDLLSKLREGQDPDARLGVLPGKVPMLVPE
jgi:hypothetical protein